MHHLLFDSMDPMMVRNMIVIKSQSRTLFILELPFSWFTVRWKNNSSDWISSGSPMSGSPIVCWNYLIQLVHGTEQVLPTMIWYMVVVVLER